jgi:cytochrome c oxidase subunit 3
VRDAHDAHGALAHHFEDLEQQKEAHALGMWTFLITEIMFFGGLFVGYAVYRTWYPDAFARASAHLDARLGGVNTAVLIASSFTMVLAVDAAARRRGKAVFGWLWATIVLGAAFLGVKYVEYADKWHHGLIPGDGFVFDGIRNAREQVFFAFYFAMTGMHASTWSSGSRCSRGCRCSPCAAATTGRDATRSRWPACTGTSSTSCGSSCSRCCT